MVGIGCFLMPICVRLPEGSIFPRIDPIICSQG